MPPQVTHSPSQPITADLNYLPLIISWVSVYTCCMHMYQCAHRSQRISVFLNHFFIFFFETLSPTEPGVHQLAILAGPPAQGLLLFSHSQEWHHRPGSRGYREFKLSSSCLNSEHSMSEPYPQAPLARQQIHVTPGRLHLHLDCF